MQVMLDLETMGVSVNAPIVSIGAVSFNELRVYNYFEANIDLEDAVKFGGIVDESTVKWWSEQSQEARDCWQKDATTCKCAFELFMSWLEDQLSDDTPNGVWGNGVAFDNVILKESMLRSGVTPWPYHLDRCYRTIKNLRPDVSLSRVGIYHRAVDDAETQARHLIAMRVL